MSIKDEVMRWLENIEYPQYGIAKHNEAELDTILSDVVRVVRCGDCKFLVKLRNIPHKDIIGKCRQYDNLPILLKTAEDYCSEGEPQETTNPNFKDGV